MKEIKLASSSEQLPEDLNKIFAGKHWTDIEFKKLVEGLKKFDHDWEKIAAYIGTKNVKQTLLKVLRV